MPGTGLVPAFTAIDLREYRYYRTRAGGAGGVDYRGSAGSTFYVRGLFSNFQNYGDRWVYSPGAGDFLTPTTTDANGTMDASLQNRRPNERIASFSGGAKHVFGSILLDYDVAASRSRQNRLDQTSVSFTGPDNVAYGIDAQRSVPAAVQRPERRQRVRSRRRSTLSALTVANERTAQRDFSGRRMSSKAYTGGSGSGLLQAGLKVRDAHKTNDVDDPAYTATGSPTLTMDMVLGTFANPDYYSGHYTLGPLADLNRIIAFQAANPSSLELSIDKTRQQDAANYQADERVFAVYGMDSMDIGRGHLSGGRACRSHAVVIYRLSRDVGFKGALRVDEPGVRFA